MVVCGACGTDNRDSARFCRGCAKALAPLTANPPAEAQAEASAVSRGPVQTCPACQASNPLAATACKSCGVSLVPDLALPAPSTAPAASGGTMGRLVVMAGLLLATTVVGAWWFGVQGRAPAPVVSSVTAIPADSPSVAMGADTSVAVVPEHNAIIPPGKEAHVAAAKADRATASARERQVREQQKQAALERRQQADRDQSAAEQRRATLALEQQRSEQVARQKAMQEAASQPPAPVMTVELSCASSSNFISRDICRLRECGKASFASDPICIRFREMEEESRKERLYQ